MTYDHISVEPLSTALGAEIGGVDLAAPLAEPALAEIRHAFGEYGVIFFRDQSLTPEQHLAFAGQFGEHRRQPLLHDRAHLSGDRRGAQGA